MKGPGGSMS